MPVAVRNLTKSQVIYSQPNKGDAIEWGYSGIPDGTDVQEVPEDIWESARMRRAVARGLVSEDTKEALDAAYAAQRAALASDERERNSKVLDALQAGDPGQSIVISSQDLDEHLKLVANRQESSALEDAQQEAAEAQAQREAAMAAERESDPMAAVNAAGSEE